MLSKLLIGIRVPAIVQWPGKIPAESQSDVWMAQTDLLPTFLDAAGVKLPSGTY